MIHVLSSSFTHPTLHLFCYHVSNETWRHRMCGGGGCVTCLHWHVLRMPLAPGHKPQAAAERNTCLSAGHRKERPTEMQREGRAAARRGAWDRQRRVKAARQTDCVRKDRLVFLVPAYLRKVGRRHVNSSDQSSHTSARGLVSVPWSKTLKQHQKVQWWIEISGPNSV